MLPVIVFMYHSESSSIYPLSLSNDSSRTSTVTISLLYHRRNRTTHSYHTQGFVLCDTDNSGSADGLGRRESFVVCKRGGFTYWSESLRAGDYVIIPFSTSFWHSDEKHRDYTLVIHSSAHLGLTIREKSSTFLADCLITATMRMCSHPKHVRLCTYLFDLVDFHRSFREKNISSIRHPTD